MQILYIRSGTADVRFEDRWLQAQGPCLLFVPARCVHGFRFSSDVDGAVLTTLTHRLDALLAHQPAWRERFAAPRHLPIDPASRAHARLAPVVERLLDEYNDMSAGRSALLDALLDAALIGLGRELGAQASLDAPGRGRRAAHHAQRFGELLNRSFREHRDLDFYAGHLGITGTQLNRVCRQELGRSALGAINDRVVTEARRDLAYSSLSVKEIAFTLGFADAAYFSRFFARQTGTAPSDFRIQARRELDARGGAPAAA